jgi:hypothetical protein
MTSFLASRTLLAATALAGVLAAPAVSLGAAGQTAAYLTALKAPAKTPVAIYGTAPAAFEHTGDKLQSGQSLMPVRVSGPAHSGIQLRFTCSSGAVTGYGYKGADELAINGRKLLGQHTVRPKVQAGVDVNHDGRLTGTVYAFCEGGR